MSTALLLMVLANGAIAPTGVAGSNSQQQIATRDIPVITVDGMRFRDLNRDGKLEPYEDWRLTPEVRAADLIQRMTVAEKAGATMHGSFAVKPATPEAPEKYDLDAIETVVVEKDVTSFLTRLAVSPKAMAYQNNLVQQVAEKGRLGIPITISSDPRHHFLYIVGQSDQSEGYSKWPETIGFSALRDPALIYRFANIARAEYRATGIQQTLSPQVDLYTEPRWARGYGGFGADPEVSREMAHAYIAGFQGGSAGLESDGVLATMKHWVGYGATVNGFDGHNAYGQISRVDAKSFPLQIEPFRGGFEVGVGAVMPTYSIVEGATVAGRQVEHVAAGFNRQMLTDLLRGEYGFKGIILSDWAITNDCLERCHAPTAQAPQRPSDLGMPWGVENLSRSERFAKGMNAGIDQFGGVAEPDLIVEDVRKGLIAPERLDDAVRRVMTAKFRLGLFEHPFVDVAAVEATVNTPEIASLALKTQEEAQVLLKTRSNVFPLKPGTRVYGRGISESSLRAVGLEPVATLERAQVALVRVNAPYQTLHPYHFIGSRQHEGRLDFPAGDPDVAAVDAAYRAKVPVIVSIFLDRPAVLGTVDTEASVLLANFGISDEGLLAAVMGYAVPRGRLPFELPSSEAAVEMQDPALPDDTLAPAYRYGAGIVTP
jgi:beta-glucosidase